jgi:hypothetical protein
MHDENNAELTMAVGFGCTTCSWVLSIPLRIYYKGEQHMCLPANTILLLIFTHS